MNSIREVRGNFTNIAVLAFGTLGDVLPVAAVTARLATIQEDCKITFITHSAHEFLRQPLALFGALFHPVSTAPVSLPPGDASVQGTQDELFEPEGHSVVDIWRFSIHKQHREQCLSAVDQIFGPEQHEGSGLIIFNFFALEGWHLAELYRVPCAVAAPYVVPYSAPASFERHFRAVQPLLYRRLQRAEFGEVGWSEVNHWMWPLFTNRWTNWRTDCLHLSACPLTDPVTELPVLPDWPRAPPLLYGFSPEVVECPEYWPKSIHVCGFWYAPPEWEALLSGDFRTKWRPTFSADIDSGPSFSQNFMEFLSGNGDPESVPLYIGLSSVGSMGYLKNPEILLKVILTVLEATNTRAMLHTASYTPLDAAVKVMMSDNISKSRNMKDDPGSDNQHDNCRLEDGVLLGGDRLFCFSQLDSYPVYGRAGHPSRFSRTKNLEALSARRYKSALVARLRGSIRSYSSGVDVCVFDFDIRMGLLDQTAEESRRRNWTNAERWLCLVYSGTTAAALRSGVPQVICPFLLDQFYWAERMAWIGVAPDPLKPRHLFPEGDEEFKGAVQALRTAVEDASTTSMRDRASLLSRKIRQEDGTSNFVRTLREELIPDRASKPPHSLESP